MRPFAQCESAATALLSKTPHAVINFVGAPGLGKTACTLKVGANLGLSGPRILVVHVNNHDIVDFTGVPSVTVDGMTIFNPPKMFYDFREGTGPGLIVLEELAQSSTHHQTWAAGLFSNARHRRSSSTPRCASYVANLIPLDQIICDFLSSK